MRMKMRFQGSCAGVSECGVVHGNGVGEQRLYASLVNGALQFVQVIEHDMRESIKGMFFKIQFLKVRVHVEPARAKMISSRDVRIQAFPSFAHRRKPHPHVPIPTLLRRRPIGLQFRLEKVMLKGFANQMSFLSLHPILASTAYLEQSLFQEPAETRHGFDPHDQRRISARMLISVIVPSGHAIDSRI